MALNSIVTDSACGGGAGRAPDDRGILLEPWLDGDVEHWLQGAVAPQTEDGQVWGETTPTSDDEPFDPIDDAVETMESQWDAGLEELVYYEDRESDGHEGCSGCEGLVSVSGPALRHRDRCCLGGDHGFNGFGNTWKSQRWTRRASCSEDVILAKTSIARNNGFDT